MVPTRSNHPYWMYEEMTATPDALDHLLAPDEETRGRRAEVAKRLAGARRIYLTGCGTAYHAALVGAAFLRDFTDGAVDARPVQAFELSHYERAAMQAGDALIALSHSGKPLETNAALAAAHEAGAYCVTVTGFLDSPAAKSADAVLDVGYGDAKSFAYTISYSLMLAELASLAAEVAAAAGQESAYVAHQAQVNVLPQMHRDALALDGEVQALAEKLRDNRRWIFAGAGGNVATALEVSLKMQETNYTSSFGMEMEEVLHGPVAALGDSVLVVIAPPGAGRTRAFDLLRAARMLVGPTVALGEAGDTELAAAADTFLALPGCPEDISPAPYHVPLHLLSYWLAVATGTNPDLMRRTEQHYLDARKSYVL